MPVAEDNPSGRLDNATAAMKARLGEPPCRIVTPMAADRYAVEQSSQGQSRSRRRIGLLLGRSLTVPRPGAGDEDVPDEEREAACCQPAGGGPERPDLGRVVDQLERNGGDQYPGSEGHDQADDLR
jgi:hypothetical protein